MKKLRTWILNWVWYVHPLVILNIQASPGDCLRAIADAAKPSLHRLHHRNLFTDGRRYYLDPNRAGFWMTSNSKIPWQRRTRTSVAAVVYAEVISPSDGTTRIIITARMRWLYFLDIFLIPLFISSILIFAPWHTSLIIAFVATLFTLSWIWHRLTAQLQAGDMIYFVQKALEDVTQTTVPELAAGEQEMITQSREFRRQWQKFFREHQAE